MSRLEEMWQLVEIDRPCAILLEEGTAFPAGTRWLFVAPILKVKKYADSK